MSRNAVIVGTSDITIDHKTSEKGAAELAADAVLAALEDAGLKRDALDHADGMITVPSLALTAESPSFIAQYLGTSWRSAISFTNGGSSPVDSLNEAARRINAGIGGFYVVCAGENLNTLQRTRPHIHMASMQLLIASLYNQRETDTEAAMLPASFAFYGAARAAKLGLSLDAIKKEYAEIISGFSRVAAQYGPAKAKETVTAEEVLASEPVATPFTKLMCANPFTDQASAFLVMDEDKARSLGIPESRFVYHHGGGYRTDHSSVEEERDFTELWSAKLANLEALAAAGIPSGETADHIAHYDLYSCFPSVVHVVSGMLGLDFEDKSRLTAAGGLARRGGSGSIYSFSAIAAMYARLNAEGGKGLVYGLGGAASSHGACVLGKEPPSPARKQDFSALEQATAEYAAIPRVTIDPAPEGEAEVVTYSVVYANPLKSRGHAPYAICIGGRGNKRFAARLTGPEPAEIAASNPADIIGRTCKIEPGKKGTVNLAL